jgi:hypothetical protein
VLVVDHKLPQDWGGTNDIDNLQPLCEQCNGGKQAWFSSYDHYSDQIRDAGRHPEPHGRIGDLLKAFNGNPVPGDVLGLVASLGAFQEDWQKRLRELRLLGWVIRNKKVHSRELGRRRVHSHYSLVHFEPYPVGMTIREAIALEGARRQRET